jgi:hypothetical protein
MRISTWQLLLLAVVMSVLIAVLVSVNSWYMDYRTLPMVYKDAGVCTKVENFENGHAFNCNDVNVTLRRYRMPMPNDFWQHLIFFR